MNRLILKKLEGILFANGSCGTAAGIFIGSALLGIKLKSFLRKCINDKRRSILHDTEKLILGLYKKLQVRYKSKF